MGQNLVLNMNDHNFRVAVFNRTLATVDAFLAGPARGTDIIGARSIAELVGHLKKPRRVMMMVKAGAVVDDFIAQITPHLEQGDIIIDGGNSLYADTNRRTKDLAEKGCPADSYRLGGLCPLSVGNEGGANQRLRNTPRPGN
jgi:6-phosphogluconate dehydrogenase